MTQRGDWNNPQQAAGRRGDGGLSVPESGGARSHARKLRSQLQELPVVERGKVPDEHETIGPEPADVMLNRVEELRSQLTSAMMVEAVNCFLVGTDDSNFGYKITWEVYRVDDDAYVLAERRENKV